MHYRLMRVFTPNDIMADRERLEVETVATEPLKAIKRGVSLLGTEYGEREGDLIVDAYLKQSVEEDTSEGFEWTVPLVGGTWTFILKPFEPADPVTKEAILDWARSKAGYAPKSTVIDVLRGVLGRHYYATLSDRSPFELRQELHELAFEGCKGWNSLSDEELVGEIMENVVPACRDNYDSVDVPFGMKSMVEYFSEFWTGD